MKIATAILTAAAAFTFSAKAQGTGTLTEREVVGAVLRENQTLKAALAKWEAMKARVPQARAWEDLRAGVDWAAERSVNIPPNSFMELAGHKSPARRQTTRARRVCGQTFSVSKSRFRVHDATGRSCCDNRHHERAMSVAVESGQLGRKYFCPMCEGVESDTPGS